MIYTMRQKSILMTVIEETVGRYCEFQSQLRGLQQENKHAEQLGRNILEAGIWGKMVSKIWEEMHFLSLTK